MSCFSTICVIFYNIFFANKITTFYFTFTMASTGDPSTFTFTLDAFPDYTRFDHTKKVLATIQTFDVSASVDDHREKTPAVTA